MARQINWQSYAGFALSVLQWTPDTFWQSTPREFATALIGWQRYILKGEASPAATLDDLNRLQARFPDT